MVTGSEKIASAADVIAAEVQLFEDRVFPDGCHDGRTRQIADSGVLDDEGGQAPRPS